MRTFILAILLLGFLTYTCAREYNYFNMFKLIINKKCNIKL